jgi:hypothetical protein
VLGGLGGRADWTEYRTDRGDRLALPARRSDAVEFQQTTWLRLVENLNHIE